MESKTNTIDLINDELDISINKIKTLSKIMFKVVNWFEDFREDPQHKKYSLELVNILYLLIEIVELETEKQHDISSRIFNALCNS